MAILQTGYIRCACQKEGASVPPPTSKKRIVLTGGPGAGKTAVLEMARRALCQHSIVLPEAASLVFKGGFPRHATIAGQKAAQRTIFHVQTQVERMVVEENKASVIICDRGTIDGCAYWPNSMVSFWSDLNTSIEKELARYAAVIHLRPPAVEHGYNHENTERIESAEAAARIDKAIEALWSNHPQRFFIDSTERFMDKATAALKVLWQQLPSCCQTHAPMDF